MLSYEQRSSFKQACSQSAPAGPGDDKPSSEFGVRKGLAVANDVACSSAANIRNTKPQSCRLKMTTGCCLNAHQLQSEVSDESLFNFDNIKIWTCWRGFIPDLCKSSKNNQQHYLRSNCNFAIGFPSFPTRSKRQKISTTLQMKGTGLHFIALKNWKVSVRKVHMSHFI